MRAYAILCESTKFYASLAGLAEATFYASSASSHAKSYAMTSLNIFEINQSIISITFGIIPFLLSLLISVGPSETSDILSSCLILEQPEQTVNLTVL